MIAVCRARLEALLKPHRPTVIVRSFDEAERRITSHPAAIIEIGEEQLTRLGKRIARGQVPESNEWRERWQVYERTVSYLVGLRGRDEAEVEAMMISVILGLAEPIDDGHGNPITAEVKEVGWSDSGKAVDFEVRFSGGIYKDLDIPTVQTVIGSVRIGGIV